MDFATADILMTAVGSALGETDWLAVTPDRVRAFADLTGDHQWIHLDDDRCANESPFGVPIVHGALVLALIPVFAGALVHLVNARRIINVGLEQARLRTALPVGRRIRGRGHLTSATPMGTGGGTLAGIDIAIEAEGERRPICTAQQRMLYHA